MSFLRHLRRLALALGNALYRGLVAVTRKDASNNTLTSTSYGYDPHGRQSTITDAGMAPPRSPTTPPIWS